MFALAKSMLAQTGSVWSAGPSRLLLSRVEPTQDGPTAGGVALAHAAGVRSTGAHLRGDLKPLANVQEVKLCVQAGGGDITARQLHPELR